MISKLYIYRHDGQSKNWMSLKIHHGELMALLEQMEQTNLEGGATVYTCPHCKNTLYGGEKLACP